MPEDLRRLPSVDQLLQEPELQALTAQYSHAAVVEGIRSVLNETRGTLRGSASVPSLAIPCEPY